MRIGIDLGGTKIEAIVLDNDGEIRFRDRCPTPQGNYQQTLLAIQSLVTACQIYVDSSSFVGRAPIGIGTPGSISSIDHRLRNCNSQCLNGKDIKADLEALLNQKVEVANDANCFALSEASDGAAAGAETVFGVIIGTGVGGGYVVQGRVLNGCNGIAGEWGHNRMPGLGVDFEDDQRLCFCGRYNCIETYLSGPGLAMSHLQRSGQQVDAAQLHQQALQGDHDALASLDYYALQLAQALAQVINILDPDCLVLGGGLSNIYSLYQRVPELWTPFVFSEHIGTRLLPPRYGDSSGVRGAAWLNPDMPE